MVDIDLSQFVTPGDALIIVPPFAGLDRPSLGAHVLQACARERGSKVSVLYANILFAAEIGELQYEAICYAPTSALLGERLFAAAAYGVPPLGRGELLDRDGDCARCEGDLQQVRVEDLQRFEASVATWLDRLVAAICRYPFPVIGCTTTFEQTAASIAILKRIKQVRPEVVSILGGANCEGEMAQGVRSLSDSIDYLFSGESEVTFTDFLEDFRAGVRPENWLIQGTPCLDMDTLPTTDFSEFYLQFDQFLPDSALREGESVWLPYESSRGCWWGQKSHCTFCGINGQTMTFRAKSAERVIQELRQLVAFHPSKKVCMVDNIMPHTYFKTLIPRLASEVPGLEMFYEQKANLSLDSVVALKNAGVALIQPGIEALSTPLLKLMDKGVTARQNLALLRYCRAADLGVNWNLLYAFPGDRMEDYERTLDLIPLLLHLQPPSGPHHLSIDRFSPYFNSPGKYQIEKLTPMESYFSVLPESAEIEKVAYHFSGEYPSASRGSSGIVHSLSEAIERWNEAWKKDKERPFLGLTPVTDEKFLLIDTRGLPGTEKFHFLERDEAAVVLSGARLERRDEVAWAIERSLLVELDSFFVPLCTASPEVLKAFEAATTHQLARVSAPPPPVLAVAARAS